MGWRGGIPRSGVSRSPRRRHAFEGTGLPGQGPTENAGDSGRSSSRTRVCWGLRLRRWAARSPGSRFRKELPLPPGLGLGAAPAVARTPPNHRSRHGLSLHGCVIQRRSHDYASKLGNALQHIGVRPFGGAKRSPQSDQGHCAGDRPPARLHSLRRMRRMGPVDEATLKHGLRLAPSGFSEPPERGRVPSHQPSSPNTLFRV